MKAGKPDNVNDFIAAFPANVQKILEQIRVTIKKAAPGVNLISRIVKFKVKQREQDQKDFLQELSAPARHALQNNNIKTLPQLAKHAEAEILELHGIGKTAIPKLQKILTEKGLILSNG